MTNALHLDAISKTFSGPDSSELKIVQDLSLEIVSGSRALITGASGSGKSTLLHMMSGLLHPDTGFVRLLGQDLYTLSRRRRAHLLNHSVGFVFQQFHLMPEFTVLENVMLPALIKHDRSRNMIRDQAKALLEQFGLSDRSDHFPATLSGGEHQRTALARALINNPSILFCDEPTGNLDADNTLLVAQALESISDTRDRTLVIVSHHPNSFSFVDHRYVLDQSVIRKF